MSFESNVGGIEKNDETESMPQIADIEEAREYIQDLFERGVRPQITVKREFTEALKEGLKPQTSWIPDLKVLAGTIGRDPYLPQDEERVVIQINDINPSMVEPRFTGPDGLFQGVVVFRGPIAPEAMQIMQ